MATAEAANPLKLSTREEIHRPLADFPECIWGDCFAAFTLDEQVYGMHAKEIKMLKEEVMNMLMMNESTTAEKLNLIDTVERLGISYRFENEIEQQLERIFSLHANFEDYAHWDLCTTALMFRLMRQHGFNIPCGVFDKFRDDTGKFKASLSNDIKGLLGLYEAAQLRTKQDTILEVALAFSTANLKSATLPPGSSLGKQAKRALEQSLHKSITRLEARCYISIYEEDESKNEILLRLAKLDYKILQMQHKLELCELTRWWKELKLTVELPYIRDRIVECYFWALGNYFEPQYSIGRIIVTKTTVMLSIINDTYDAYGTLEELEIFTDVLQRWDSREIEMLPSYLKTCYRTLLKVTNDVEKELTKQGRPYHIHYYKEAWKEYGRACNIKSNWLFKRDIPTFDDYTSIGLITSTFNVISVASFTACDSSTKDVLDWAINFPKIMVPTMAICRFLNDVASHKFENQRGSATGIDSYMKYFNASEEEAMEKLEEIAEDAWKDINEEWLKPSTIPREILMRIVNLARLSDVCYKRDVDGYTHPIKLLKPYIIAMLLDPVTV